MKLKKAVLPLVFIFLFFFIPAGHSDTINFDNLNSGDPVTTIQGVTFSSNISGYTLVVSNIFDTTSGSKYLGVGDGGLEVFFPGDVVTLTFANPITSLTANFISSPNTPGEIFSIDAGALGSGISGTLPTLTLGDGGEVFPVSFSSVTPFTVASLTGADGFYSYNVDDISFNPSVPIPEPSTVTFLGLGLGAVLFARYRIFKF